MLLLYLQLWPPSCQNPYLPHRRQGLLQTNLPSSTVLKSTSLTSRSWMSSWSFVIYFPRISSIGICSSTRSAVLSATTAIWWTGLRILFDMMVWTRSSKISPEHLQAKSHWVIVEHWVLVIVFFQSGWVKYFILSLHDSAPHCVSSPQWTLWCSGNHDWNGRAEHYPLQSLLIPYKSCILKLSNGMLYIPEHCMLYL